MLEDLTFDAGILGWGRDTPCAALARNSIAIHGHPSGIAAQRRSGRFLRVRARTPPLSKNLIEFPVDGEPKVIQEAPTQALVPNLDVSAA